jgi:hypothetical protein
MDHVWWRWLLDKSRQPQSELVVYGLVDSTSDYGLFRLGNGGFSQNRSSLLWTIEHFINTGGVLDLNDQDHILFSVGHTIQGQCGYQSYLAIQFTFGPEKDE